MCGARGLLEILGGGTLERASWLNHCAAHLKFIQSNTECQKMRMICVFPIVLGKLKKEKAPCEP